MSVPVLVPDPACTRTCMHLPIHTRSVSEWDNIIGQ